MYENLSVEIKVPSAKIEAKHFRDVSNTFTTTVSLNSKNSTQSPVKPVPPKVSPIVTLVQRANNDKNLHPLVRDSAKVTNLVHSMRSSYPEPTVTKQQSAPKPRLLNH
ncbi:unnamed protein product [Hymenolepis diminuta]|uniref:Uncharacterized protein n=1 Tax=Hymenolepis diminuta TaxID=6216 RepID=A0A564YKV4_HYMDI|nr:unnamed protein product [Hymenolepis diminuta]